jgi:hypothetical protein
MSDLGLIINKVVVNHRQLIVLFDLSIQIRSLLFVATDFLGICWLVLHELLQVDVNRGDQLCILDQFKRLCD